MGRNTTFKRTVFAHAVLLAIAATVSTGAVAQSNTTGNIFGQATAGATSVVIQNVATGAKRTLTPDASGRFQATAMPPGQYKIESLKGGAVAGVSEVDVSVGQGSEVRFAAGTSLSTVQVVGTKARIDVSSTNNGATFTAKQLDALPVGKSVEAVIQLAPNTTRADSRFSGGASFGGGAASENSYYINGFPVVNPLTGLGASQLPFGAIAEAQVITGGFGAEFGRSVGGVVNVITKSGTNKWEAGVSYAISPSSLRAKSQDLYYADTRKYSGNATYNAATDGTLRVARAENTNTTATTSAYVGGPLIEDKLFFFGAFENSQADTGRVVNTRIATSNAQNGWREESTNTKRYLAKIDWNVTNDHRLELTAIGDTPVRTIADSGYDYATRSRVGVVTSQQTLTNIDSNGGDLKMLKYTGNLTPDFTVTALMGESRSKHINEFPNYNPNAVLFSSVSDPSVRAPGFTYANPQAITGNVLPPGAEDIVKSTRLDFEYILGKHTIRFGIDKNEITSNGAGEFKAGGGTWTYFRTDTPGTELDTASGTTVPGPGANGGLGAQGYYVRKDLFTDVTASSGVQEAQYIEDKYQITKNVLLTAGIRRESFKNMNESGAVFLDNAPQLLPRFAAAWDVNGDATLKVFGTLGRYSVPIPTHIAVRGAGASTFTEQYFTYTGVDAATGAPTGLQQLGGGPFSGNNEYGQAKVVETLAALDMKPSYQDDITFGFEKAFSPSLNFGGKVTYRTLKSTIDDFCDVRPFAKYAADKGIAITNPLWGNTCQTFNPGVDNTFKVQFGVDPTKLTTVALTKAQQGFDDVKRTYTAVDVFAEHPLKDGWYGKVNYTWSRNQGNTEGQVRSDNGQADVAVTSVWDYPELMAGAEGLLPNDRTHQIKAYGFLELSREWGIGANVLIASGRPRSCIGSAPSNPNGSPDYANQTFYCLGTVRSANVLTPRGTVGNLPTDSRLDLSVSYKPAAVKGLQLRADVFNVFDAQTVQNVEERYNNGTRIRNTYEGPLSLTAARSVKLTASYDYKF
jgi:outer membrane receptor protein involved in Fe transport